MCVTGCTAPPTPRECVTFRTIRRALDECESKARTRGFHDEARVAYVIASLRAQESDDCHKAAHLIMRMFGREFPA